MRICLSLAMSFALGIVLSAQEAAPAKHNPERTRIENAAKKFVSAYNDQDLQGLVALFSEDAEMVERSGQRFVGKSEIEAAFAESFEGSPHAKISLAVDSLRFITPDVAVEEGVTTWFPDGQTATVESTYRVAQVRRNGKWLMAGVRTIDDEVLNTYEHLRDLEWMAGDWIDEGSDSIVASSIRWTANRAFLLREFSIKVGGQTIMSGTQRIGWDPLKQQFRSWMFDSEGGYTQGSWTRVGDGYVIRSSGYLRDGTAVSGTTRVDRHGRDRISWSLFNRLRGDEIMPDVNLTIVRTPPQPKGDQ